MTLALVPARLGELEAVIERGQPTFIEVGLALAEIRDTKLYRADYGTFDAYCRDRWGWSRQRGYQLIAAAEMSTTVDKPPANEWQTRVPQVPPLPAHTALVGALKVIEQLAAEHTVEELAQSIPVKSQERFVRRLRRSGTFLGHIAYIIEEGERA